jgi:hypothetical protein
VRTPGAGRDESAPGPHVGSSKEEKDANKQRSTGATVAVVPSHPHGVFAYKSCSSHPQLERIMRERSSYHDHLFAKSFFSFSIQFIKYTTFISFYLASVSYK